MVELRFQVPLLIAFVDLSRYAALSQRLQDVVLAEAIDAYYECVARAVEDTGGTLVKFIGDAALIVFPEPLVDRGVEAILALKPAVDALMAERGYECRLGCKVHFGEAIAGRFGAAGAKRYDVIGKAVNTAARLDSGGVTLSVEAFRKLGPELRRRFKKHTPPVSYIRVEDPHRG